MLIVSHCLQAQERWLACRDKQWAPVRVAPRVRAPVATSRVSAVVIVYLGVVW
jgi:hypothetical protein